MPRTTTFFSPRFGMTTDRFAVPWMVYVAPPGSAKAGRSEALAKQFEAKAEEAIATLQRLGDADWRKVTQAETWSVGVTAHHMAGVLEAIAGMIETVASGRPFESFNPSSIDEMNARHARDYAGRSKAETIELFRKGVGLSGGASRRLRDHQTATTPESVAT